MILKQRLLIINMFLSMMLSIAIIIIHFNEENKTEVNEIRKSNNKIHKFIYLNKNNMIDLLHEEWVLCVNCDVNSYENLSIYQLLFVTNISILNIDSLETAMVSNKFCVSKIPMVYYIKNGVLLGHNNKTIRILDLNKKCDLINVIDLHCLSLLFSIFKYLRSYIHKFYCSFLYVG